MIVRTTTVVSLILLLAAAAAPAPGASAPQMGAQPENADRVFEPPQAQRVIIALSNGIGVANQATPRVQIDSHLVSGDTIDFATARPVLLAQQLPKETATIPRLSTPASPAAIKKRRLARGSKIAIAVGLGVIGGGAALMASNADQVQGPLRPMSGGNIPCRPVGGSSLPSGTLCGYDQVRKPAFKTGALSVGVGGLVAVLGMFDRFR